ncbi:hypothetical protein AAF712_015571 [Marasmius tenuissimus]|uniref:F-box domain-containing protein n=1 Tax=Marasmius tenuissimus TaxID=585030 RepID=A0ABR2ZA39_9AGAR
MNLFPMPHPYLERYNYSEIFKVIAGYCRRWKSLSLYRIHPQILDPFRSLSGEDMPLLEGFHDFGTLDYPMGANGQSLPWLLLAIGNSVSLRDLHIVISGGFNFLDFRIQWARLRALQITITRPADGIGVFWGLVEACPLLSDLSLTLSHLEAARQLFNMEVAHPRHLFHLRRLNLAIAGRSGADFDSTVMNIFESITTPALHHLSLRLSTHYRDRDMVQPHSTGTNLPLQNFIARSQCILTSLELDMDFGSGFPTILDNSTSLTALSLRSPNWDPRADHRHPRSPSQLEAIIQTLTPSNESIWYPNVEEIVLKSCSPELVFALVDLIEARARATRLKSFTADFWFVTPAKAKILASARELAKSKNLGIKIEWRYQVVVQPMGSDDPQSYSTAGRGVPTSISHFYA